jgi:hypothetical protein
MNMRTIRFPVVCPICGSESLSELKFRSVALALGQDRPLRLYAGCHDLWWNATDVQAEQVREYVVALMPGEELSATG